MTTALYMVTTFALVGCVILALYAVVLIVQDFRTHVLRPVRARHRPSEFNHIEINGQKFRCIEFHRMQPHPDKPFSGRARPPTWYRRVR